MRLLWRGIVALALRNLTWSISTAPIVTADVGVEVAPVQVDVANESAFGELAVETNSDGEASEEKELKVEAKEFGISMMLLGGIVSVMALFIATNVEDEDMRFYVWKVISATISILVAVMVFTSINDLMHKSILAGMEDKYHVLWDFAQCFVYISLMELIVAVCVLAASEPELNMRCWGHLMAHASGFSAIHFGGCMQQGKLFAIEVNSVLQFVAPAVMAFGLWVSFVCLRLFRGWITRNLLEEIPEANQQLSELSERTRQAAYSAVPQEDPGVSPEITTGAGDMVAVKVSPDRTRATITGLIQGHGQHRNGHAIYVMHDDLGKWEATIYEAENDVSSLCVSFLAVQALRSIVTGAMPDEMGNELLSSLQTPYLHMQIVGGCAVGFTLLAVILETLSTKFFTADHLADMAAMSQGFSWNIFFFLLGKRCTLVGAQGAAMGMAWCLLCDSQWMLHRWCPSIGSPESITFKVLLAVAISCFAFIVVWCLDKLADAHLFEGIIDRSIIAVILSLGVLVGFAWEHSFDEAVKVVVDVIPCPPLINKTELEMTGTLLICTFVVYSWRRHILYKVLTLEKLREEAGHPC